MAIPLSQWARDYLGALNASFLETADECVCVQQVDEGTFVCWVIKREEGDAVTARMIRRDMDAIEAIQIAFEHAAEWSRKGPTR